jgi:hypothetical protein
MLPRHLPTSSLIFRRLARPSNIKVDDRTDKNRLARYKPCPLLIFQFQPDQCRYERSKADCHVTKSILKWRKKLGESIFSIAGNAVLKAKYSWR